MSSRVFSLSLLFYSKHPRNETLSLLSLRACGILFSKVEHRRNISHSVSFSLFLILECVCFRMLCPFIDVRDERKAIVHQLVQNISPVVPSERKKNKFIISNKHKNWKNNKNQWTSNLKMITPDLTNFLLIHAHRPTSLSLSFRTWLRNLCLPSVGHRRPSFPSFHSRVVLDEPIFALHQGKTYKAKVSRTSGSAFDAIRFFV